MNIEQKVQSLLTAANAATGEADSTLTDAIGSLIAGYGGGETVYYNVNNVGYTRHMVAPGTRVLVGSQFSECVNLESIEMPNWEYSPSGGIFDLFANCKSLKAAMLPKCTWIGRKMFSGCTALEQVQLGSIGYPVTGASSLSVFSNVAATITVYVDAAQISDIPTSIIDNAPWGAARATIVYRNSTTGEVIEA